MPLKSKTVTAQCWLSASFQDSAVAGNMSFHPFFLQDAVRLKALDAVQDAAARHRREVLRWDGLKAGSASAAQAPAFNKDL